MDQNGYSDLLVGAYENDAVALLRSKKIIDITTSIRYLKKDRTYQDKIEPIDPNKFGCSEDLDSNHTWQVEFKRTSRQCCPRNYILT